MKTTLMLNTTPELEEEMVDYLLSLEKVKGFTSYPVRGHGEHSYLSIAEQVSGRRKRVQFEVMLDEDDANSALSGMSAAVGKDIRYWLIPIQRVGRVDDHSCV